MQAPTRGGTSTVALATDGHEAPIGPIALDVSGLLVNLSEIALDITAQSSARNLLGNLLRAVAGLLDRPGGLARALNDIVGLLV